MDLDHIQAFLAVVDHGSFAAAARASGIPRGTLRSRVEALEEELGVHLILRSPAGTEPTAAAALAVPRLRTMVATRDALRRDLSRHTDHVEEPLRVVAPPGFPPRATASLLGLIWASHGGLRLRLEALTDPLAAAPSDVDVVLHFGDAPADRSWYSRVVIRLTLRALASESYLGTRGTPSSLEELTTHRLFLWSGPETMGSRIPLRDGSHLEVAPSLVTPDIHLVRWLACLDLGIAVVPDAPLQEPHGMPPLVRILPELVDAPVVVRASTAGRASRGLNTLLEALSGILPGGD